MVNQLYAHKCSQVVFVFGCAGSPLPRGSFSLAVASPCRDLSLAKRGLWGMQASAAVARGLGTFSSLSLGPGSVIVAHRLSCSGACGIFLDQRWNLCFLHEQAGSLPLSR